MDDHECAAIERECERLVMRYCHFVDQGEAARMPELFTDGGICHLPGIRMVGHDEILDWMTARQKRSDLRSRHVCSTFLCDVIDEDHATGVVYLTLFRSEGADDDGPVGMSGPSLVGEYRDDFVRTQNGWRISDRELIVSFVREDS